MSYLHCPTCRRAYHAGRLSACPHCGIRPGAPEDATDAVVDAAAQLAQAIARATPAQLAEARDRLSRRALCDGGLSPVLTIVGSPLPVAPTARRGHEALLATIVLALLARLPRERFGVRRAVRALWARLG
jgi:hypothetical protein